MHLQHKCLWKDHKHSLVLFFSFLSHLAAGLCVFMSYFLFSFLIFFKLDFFVFPSCNMKGENLIAGAGKF